MPFISKIFEKLVKTQALHFINDNDLLYDRQFGFRSGFSTEDAILHFTHDCVTSLDNRLFTIAIFLDFSKAFDTVNKDILLRKLDRLGFRNSMNDFFRSYLSDRNMYVSVNGYESRTVTTNIGLPQGSVSAPWLFSLYINDMHRTSDKLKFIHFADDTTVYMSGSNLNALCEEVCMELNVVDEWLKTNRLSLNADKTHFMVISHSNFDLNDCIIKIRDIKINPVTSTKFLGVLIDHKFNFNPHLNSLAKQLSRTKGILFKLSHFLPPLAIKDLYYALFYSKLLYCISVWGGSNKTGITRVTKLNESAKKLFVNKLPVEMPVPFNFDFAYKLKLLSKFHFYSKESKIPYFNNLINALIPDHNHSTRFSQASNFILPSINKSVSLNQFFFNAIKIWNSLPTDFKTINCSDTFKSKVKLYFRNT